MNPDEAYPSVPLPVVDVGGDEGASLRLVLMKDGEPHLVPLDEEDPYVALENPITMDPAETGLLARTSSNCITYELHRESDAILELIHGADDPLRRYLLAKRVARRAAPTERDRIRPLLDLYFNEVRQCVSASDRSPELLTWLGEEEASVDALRVEQDAPRLTRPSPVPNAEGLAPPSDRRSDQLVPSENWSFSWEGLDSERPSDTVEQTAIRGADTDVEIMRVETGQFKRLGRGRQFALSLKPDVYLARYGNRREYFAAGDHPQEVCFGIEENADVIANAKKHLGSTLRFCRNSFSVAVQGAQHAVGSDFQTAAAAGKRAFHLAQLAGVADLARLTALSLANLYGLAASAVGSASLSVGFHHVFSKGSGIFAEPVGNRLAHPRTAVVIDDEDHFLDYARGCLVAAGAHVKQLKAAALLEHVDFQPDVLILDLMLGSGGLAAAERALRFARQRFGSALPVLLVTSRFKRTDPSVEVFMGNGPIGFSDKSRLLADGPALAEDAAQVTALARHDVGAP